MDITLQLEPAPAHTRNDRYLIITGAIAPHQPSKALYPWNTTFVTTGDPNDVVRVYLNNKKVVIYEDDKWAGSLVLGGMGTSLGDPYLYYDIKANAFVNWGPFLPRTFRTPQ